MLGAQFGTPPEEFYSALEVGGSPCGSRAQARGSSHGRPRTASFGAMNTVVRRNEYGVLDHHVTLPSGEIVYNPMRVIADGSCCEVVFTLRRRPGMSDEDFRCDADAVAADLTRLKRVFEGR